MRDCKSPSVCIGTGVGVGVASGVGDGVGVSVTVVFGVGVGFSITLWRFVSCAAMPKFIPKNIKAETKKIVIRVWLNVFFIRVILRKRCVFAKAVR